MEQAGRPTTFPEIDLEHVEDLVRLSYTPRMIARALDVDEANISRWRRQFPEFGKLLESAKDYAVEAVTNVLKESALGFEHDEEKIHFDSDGNVSTHDTVKKHKPEVAAQKFLLLNRDPTNWRDRREEVTEHTGEITLRWGAPAEQPPEDWLD